MTRTHRNDTWTSSVRLRLHVQPFIALAALGWAGSAEAACTFTGSAGPYVQCIYNETVGLWTETANLQSEIDAIPDARGVLYTRWGRADCPAGSNLVYSGYTGGGHYTYGGPGNHVCLAETPTWNNFNDADNTLSAELYGTEFEMEGSGVGNLGIYHNYEARCAVCEVATADLTFMRPGRTDCPAGWTLEYTGYLMGGQWQQPRGSELLCVDAAPDLYGSSENHDGALLYTTEVECGALDCAATGYVQNRELTCAVCTK